MSHMNSLGHNDTLHPLHLSTSDNPSQALVNKPFDGHGFQAWKRSVTIALSARNKLGLVDGTIDQPNQADTTYGAWERVNNMVISWILNSVEKDIADSLLFCNNAREIWKELENRFEQSNGTQLFQLQKELVSISQGTNSISTYYTKIKKIWDELFCQCILPVCTCGVASQIAKFQEDQKLIQFLMGLNESYLLIRGNILMMTPLPTVSQAYALLIQEERQREVNTTVQFGGDSTSFHVNTNKGKVSFQKSNADNKGGNKVVECRYCKKKGHTIDKCYKLHGFPANYSFNRNKRFAANVQNKEHGKDGNTLNTSDTHIIQGTGLNQEQFAELINILKQTQITAESAKDVDGKSEVAALTTFAGPFNEEATGSW